MSNPNNCKTYEYTKINAGKEGHCYMFKDEPTNVCMAHTGRMTKLEGTLSDSNFKAIIYNEFENKS